MSVAGWLSEKAKSYVADAERLRHEPEVGEFTGEQWAMIYRAVAEELRTCASEVER